MASKSEEGSPIDNGTAKEINGTHETSKTTEQPAAAKKPGLLKRIWQKSGLDVFTLLMMVKGALPPTIGIAMYQSTAVADEYATIGYLVAISANLGMCILPRAKFIQTMAMNVFSICLIAAIQVFVLWTIDRARQNTAGPLTPPAPGEALIVPYNSSASAVAAVWLFFEIYFVNVMRSARPALQFPAIISTIFISVSLLTAPRFPNFSTCEAFMRRLLITFLTGFGLATGVSLIIIPVSMRTVVFKEMTGYMTMMRGMLKAQQAYLDTIKHPNVFGAGEIDGNEDKEHSPASGAKGKAANSPGGPQSAAVNGLQSSLLGLHGKLIGDLPFGRREIAWGKLNASDMSQILHHLRRVMLPMTSLNFIVPVFEHVRADIVDSKAATEDPEAFKERRDRTTTDWHAMMELLGEPFAEIETAIDQGLQHVLLTLELIKPPKSKGAALDVEATGDTPKPGQREFSAHFDRKIQAFYDSRQVTLREWAQRKGFDLPANLFDDSYEKPAERPWMDHPHYVDNQSQLFVVLYMEYLLWSIGRALSQFIGFAEGKVADGTMKKNRLIVPGWHRMKKWFLSVVKNDDGVGTDHEIEAEARGSQFYLGQAFHDRKDPEHLPPTTTGQRLGNLIRKFPRILRSEHSAFGFRVAAATMSIGIVNFLEHTQQFANQQRLVWALIMVAISMTRLAGQSLFQFTLRLFGTLVAMVASFIIWYIVDGKTAGVIVFMGLGIASTFYVVLKQPRFLMVGIICAVTIVLILGYELQTRKIGIALSESSGQPFYPVYELAPYRLATVAAGLFVAYVWTIFPYPISEHSELRRELGSALYVAANYYSVIHETIALHVRGDDGDDTDDNLKQKKYHKSQHGTHSNTPSAQLEHLRNTLLAKQLALITNLNMYAEFDRWEFAVGGRFPIERYKSIIDRVKKFTLYSTVLGYTSVEFSTARGGGEVAIPATSAAGASVPVTTKSSSSPDPAADTTQPYIHKQPAHETTWQRDFRHLVSRLAPTSHEMVSVLALLASSISNGVPLPPYQRIPEPLQIVRAMEALDADLLSVRHIAEPGYAAFAVMQIMAREASAELKGLVEDVKEVVGELDFSFRRTAPGVLSDEDMEHGNLSGTTLGGPKEKIG